MFLCAFLATLSFFTLPESILLEHLRCADLGFTAIMSSCVLLNVCVRPQELWLCIELECVFVCLHKLSHCFVSVHRVCSGFFFSINAFSLVVSTKATVSSS